MKDRPIIFSDAMVRAILRGQKTQTRRPVKPQPVRLPAPNSNYWEWGCKGFHSEWVDNFFSVGMSSFCPFGNPGDRLWVRETFYKYYPSEGWPAPKALYRADGITLESMDSEGKRQRWTPSIHMPRALSRITLEITGINVERVWDITGPEAIAEGAHEVHKIGDDPTHPTWTMGSGMWRYDSPREAFASAWDSIYAKRGLGWDANPWVWVVKFKRVEE